MKGIGVSPGIAIGRAFVMQKKETLSTGILLTTPEEKEAAITQFDMAIAKATAEIEQIKNSPSLSEEDSAILEAQIELLSDPEIRDNVIDKIEDEDKNANDALLEVVAGFIEVFESMDDEYMQARSADIKDIGHRIIRNLQSAENKQTVFEPDTILIAKDLSPSDTITLDIKKIAGFATQVGGKTSHAVIIAKSKGLPAIVGCGYELNAIQTGDAVMRSLSFLAVILFGKRIKRFAPMLGTVAISCQPLFTQASTAAPSIRCPNFIFSRKRITLKVLG